MKDRFLVIPFVKIDGDWNIRLSIMSEIWTVMGLEGKRESVFYAGEVTNAEEWLNHVTNPANIVCIVWDNIAANIVFIAWINNIEFGVGQVHFCSLGSYKRGSAEAVLEFWRELGQHDSRAKLQVLIGITPSNNTKAVRMIDVIGFKKIGTIPNMLYDYKNNRRMDAVISHWQMEV